MRIIEAIILKLKRRALFAATRLLAIKKRNIAVHVAKVNFSLIKENVANEAN